MARLPGCRDQKPCLSADSGRALAFEELGAVLPEVVERRKLLVAGAGDPGTILLRDPALEVLVYHYALERDAPPLKLQAGNGGQPRLVVVLHPEQKEGVRTDIEIVIHLVLLLVANT